MIRSSLLPVFLAHAEYQNLKPCFLSCFINHRSPIVTISPPNYRIIIFLREDTRETNVTGLKKTFVLDTLWLDRSVLFVLWQGRMIFSNAEAMFLLVENILTICSLQDLKSSDFFLFILKNESQSDGVWLSTSKFLCKPLPFRLLFW